MEMTDTTARSLWMEMMWTASVCHSDHSGRWSLPRTTMLIASGATGTGGTGVGMGNGLMAARVGSGVGQMVRIGWGVMGCGSGTGVAVGRGVNVAVGRGVGVAVALGSGVGEGEGVAAGADTGEGEGGGDGVAEGVGGGVEGEEARETGGGDGEPLIPAARVSPNTAAPTSHSTTKARTINVCRIRHSRGLILHKIIPSSPVPATIALACQRFSLEIYSIRRVLRASEVF